MILLRVLGPGVVVGIFQHRHHGFTGRGVDRIAEVRIDGDADQALGEVRAHHVIVEHFRVGGAVVENFGVVIPQLFQVDVQTQVGNEQRVGHFHAGDFSNVTFREIFLADECVNHLEGVGITDDVSAGVDIPVFGDNTLGDAVLNDYFRYQGAGQHVAAQFLDALGVGVRQRLGGAHDVFYAVGQKCIRGDKG